MKQYKLKINGNDYDVTINSVVGDIAQLTVNGTDYMVEIQKEEQKIDIPDVQRPAPSSALSLVNPVTRKAKPSGAERHIESPLDGTILAVKVKEGQAVKAGQTVAILEAMKMENEIQSEFDGTVVSVNVERGEHVALGTPIVTIG